LKDCLAGTWARLACGVGFVWICSPSVSAAAWTATPYAAEDIEHNSNIYDAPRGIPAALLATEGFNGTAVGDTLFNTRVGIDGTYQLERQNFFGTAEYRRIEYENLTNLDHNESLFAGGLNWKLLHSLDGVIEYRHEQRMVQFQDLTAGSTGLTLETDSTAHASFNVLFTPEWRLESSFRDHSLSSPRAAVPGLDLHEDTVNEGLRYLGVTHLSAGLDLQYLSGKYEHDPLALNPEYHQESVGLAAAYAITGKTNFDGSVGYSKRSDPTNAGLSGVTGSIGYRRSITPKTSITAQLNRTLSTYVTTGGNLIETSATLGANWQFTYKTGITAGYTYTNSKYPVAGAAIVEGPGGAPIEDRTDRYQTANLELSYQVLHWLSIRAYGRYQTRHSTDPLFAFNGTVVGVEFLAKRVPRR
jgi:hypothetical protein